MEQKTTSVETADIHIIVEPTDQETMVEQELGAQRIQMTIMESTGSSGMVLLAMTVNSEADAASEGERKICVAQKHKMVVAITGSATNNGRTFGTTGFWFTGTIELGIKRAPNL